MSKLLAARGSQDIQCAEFTFNFDDTMVDVSGAVKDFGETNATSTTFEIVNLPREAVVVGGDVITEVAFTEDFTIAIGDATTGSRYLTATNRKTVGRTALVPTGFRSEENIRMTIVPGGVVTTGKATVRVHFITPDRVTEANPL